MDKERFRGRVTVTTGDATGVGRTHAEQLAGQVVRVALDDLSDMGAARAAVGPSTRAAAS